jgi:hypothetical protein
MGLKDLILNKGWAGRTLDRTDTAERINALMHPLVELMYHYEAGLGGNDPESVSEGLHSALSMLRADIGKLGEIVYSCGGVAYTGVDIDPASIGTSGAWPAVLDRERAFLSLLQEERDVEHQMRARAVIGAVATGCKARISRLQRLV